MPRRNFHPQEAHYFISLARLIIIKSSAAGAAVFSEEQRQVAQVK
jgi:hypothetical protein